MAIVQRTKTYAVCPTCGADAGQIDHLLGQKTWTRWYCDACGHSYQLDFKADGSVDISPWKGQILKTVVLLKLAPQSKPVYFIIEGMRTVGEGHDQTPEERQGSARFLYEENSCPTNWLKPEMVYFDGDSDPHGLIEFVAERDDAEFPPDESVSPNDRDVAIIALIEQHANVVR